MKPLSRVWSLLLCLYLLLNIKPTAERCLNHRDEVSPKRYLYYGEQTLDLRIEMSERVSHQLVSEILKILLEEVAGYANVSLIKKDDLMNATVVLNRLSGCQNKSCRFRQSPDNTTKSFVPNTMVNLEVWTGPGFNMEEWTTHSAIEDCGPLGPIGRFGWFIPSNLATDEWQKHHIIDHWRSLQEEDVAKIFNLAEDYDKIKAFMKPKKIRHKHCDAKECEEGFYRPKICRQMPPCATLLASHPDFSLRMIRDQIDILKLRVEVAWIGNALDGYVTSRYLENKPVLFFNWKPSILTSGGNFTNIAFPQCEDLPISFPFPTNCEFEINQIQKLAWSELNNAAPEAMEIIRKITFDQNQYKDFLEEAYRNVTSKNVSGMACDWLVGNERIWRHWIPEKIEKKPIIYIGGIFPMSGINYSSRGIIPSVTMAIEAINKNQSILQHYSLQLLTEDGRCSPDYVMRAFINYVTSPHYQRMAGILGPACSDTVEPIAGVAKHFHTIIISYSAEGAIPFSNMKEFPYFFRTIPSNRLFKYVYLQLFRSLEWTRVAALTMDGMKYPEYLSLTQDYLQKNGINFIANRKLSRELQASSMSQPLEDLKKKKARIIIGDFYDYTARMVMCEAYKQGMTARNGYVWFLPMWFQKNWYDTDYHNTLNETYPAFAQVPCSTAEMIRAINGHLGLVYSYYGQDSDLMQEGISVGEWRTRYKKRVENEIREDEISDYAGYAYDAVWVYAYALDKLLSRNHSYIATLHTEKTAKMYVDILNQTNIDGVSGPIRFLGPTRLSVINVLQWVDNKTRLVGRYIPNSLEVGNLELNTSTFTWLIHNGKKPGDGREGSDTCALEGLRQMLDVDCEVAIVVANILGFGLFALLMILCFIFFKRRYERKVKLTEARMRELGLTTSTTMLTLDEWEIPRDRVVLNRKLGEGAFGTVYGGEAFFGEKGWVPVAVKTLKVGSTVEEKLDFLSEAEMMKRFDHKNVVCLLGVCTRGEPVYTIMEFMLYGDLKTYLLARRYMVNEKTLEDSDEVSNRRLTSMALDVARGLSYLAELKYVHRDLACRNCLVNSNRVVKIGDFGMTRPMYDSDYYRFNKKGMLPVRWMAPESLADGIFTPMSDVWSYGVLLYEIITFGSFPFQGLSNNQVLDFVKSGNTLSIPNGCKPQLEALLQSCWMRNAQDRPTASGIVEQLANNPRLVSPCLDLDPLASVEIEGTDSLEFQLPERPRKYSVSMNNKLVPNNRRRSGQIDLDLLSHSGTQESMPMVVCTGNGGPVLPEPNKNINTWCQNPYQSRYVTLQHNDDKPDGDYCNELPKELWQNVTCL